MQPVLKTNYKPVVEITDHSSPINGYFATQSKGIINIIYKSKFQSQCLKSGVHEEFYALKIGDMTGPIYLWRCSQLGQRTITNHVEIR